MTAPRRGSTLLDVLIATILLGIIGVGVARGLARIERTSGISSRRAQAVQVTRNALERMRAAGPLAATALGTPPRATNEADEYDASASALFAQNAAETFVCAGGRNLDDNIWAQVGATRDMPTGACANGQRPVRIHRLTVDFFDPAVDAGQGGRISFPVAVGMRGRDSLTWVQP